MCVCARVCVRSGHADGVKLQHRRFPQFDCFFIMQMNPFTGHTLGSSDCVCVCVCTCRHLKYTHVIEYSEVVHQVSDSSCHWVVYSVACVTADDLVLNTGF